MNDDATRIFTRSTPFKTGIVRESKELDQNELHSVVKK